MLEVSEMEEGVVALNLPTGPLKRLRGSDTKFMEAYRSAVHGFSSAVDRESGYHVLTFSPVAIVTLNFFWQNSKLY